MRRVKKGNDPPHNRIVLSAVVSHAVTTVSRYICTLEAVSQENEDVCGFKSVRCARDHVKQIEERGTDTEKRKKKL
jgi:hypothetical protein